MPPVNQADVEKYGGIRNPTWLENQPMLSNVLNVLGEVSGVFPSRRIWRDVVKAWQERDKPVQVLPSAGAMLDKTAGKLSDVLNMASPGMDVMDLAKVAGLYAPFRGKAYPGSNAFSALWDKKPRVEISDDLAKIKMSKEKFSRRGTQKTLGEVLEHPELYKQFSELESMPIIPGSGNSNYVEGGYLKKWGQEPYKTPGRIEINTKDYRPETIIHETGHALQDKGGMARGGSPTGIQSIKEVLDKLKLQKRNLLDKYGGGIVNLKGMHPEDRRELDHLDKAIENPKKYLLKYYTNLAGEFEARDAASRMNLTPEQRITTPPYSSENIPLEDLIVRMEGGGLSKALRGYKK